MSERIIEGVKDDPERFRVHVKEIILKNGRHIFDAVLYDSDHSMIPGFMRIEAQEQDCQEGVEFIPYANISSFIIEKEQLSKTMLKYRMI